MDQERDTDDPTTAQGDAANQLEDRIYRRIVEADYDAYRKASFKGAPADIAVPSNYGGTVVIDAKSWRPEAYAASASPYISSSPQYEEIGAHRLIALDESYGRYPVEAPFVFERDLPDRLRELTGGPEARPARPPGLDADPIDIFVAMPFADSFGDVYFLAMLPAAESVHAAAYREDYDGESGDVMARIRSRIESCSFVAADITSLRPNVLYEVGLAHAIGKRTVIAASTETEIPFDLAHQRVTKYDWNSKHKLQQDLKREFRKEVRNMAPSSVSEA